MGKLLLTFFFCHVVPDDNAQFRVSRCLVHYMHVFVCVCMCCICFAYFEAVLDSVEWAACLNLGLADHRCSNGHIYVTVKKCAIL
jgi:hypothetical protein